MSGPGAPRRLVVCYDVSGGRVVKGRSFVDLRDQGSPAELLTSAGVRGADEIVLLDIDGTPEGRQAFLAAVRCAAAATDLPVTAGGGVRCLADAEAAFAAGASRVAVNSAFVTDPGLIDEAARAFGGQRLVASIDARRAAAGFQVFVGGGRVATGLDPVAWAQECAARGAGQLLLTSIDRDGQRCGFDLELTRSVASAVAVPVTASGGAGNAQHLVQLFQNTRAAAALAAGIIHDGSVTASDLKCALRRAGIPTARRPEEAA